MKFAVPSDKMEGLVRRFEALGVQEEDLEERFIRAQGSGGQKVNKTSVAVFLKHVPSGTEVKVQSTRSQSVNRFMARLRLADKMEAAAATKAMERQQQAAKAKRQNRRRSKRAKERMLADKHRHGEKKRLRKNVRRDDD